MNGLAIRRIASGHADNSLQLYALLTLELWMQMFLDQSWRFDVPLGPVAALA
jgi:hypothetical protein